MRKTGLILGVLLLIFSCRTDQKIKEDIAAIPVDVEIIRFDKIFAEAEISDLPALKQAYPLFFPEKFADSIWVQRVTDTLQQQLSTEVASVFPSEEKFSEPLTSLFQHIKYYFPEFNVPKIYTTTSDVDYRTKVISNDSLLILELDTYLGSEHPFYEGIARYIVKHMDEEYIASDVASLYAKRRIAVPRTRTFLDQMIYFGKELYLKELWMPETPEAIRMGYLETEMEWAHENETDIWRYFIENELLYSTDPKLSGRFILPAPFSKFNLELDNESPGMIGRYIGWQIVKAYADNNPEISLNQLLLLSAADLFNNSKYKPKK